MQISETSHFSREFDSGKSLETLFESLPWPTIAMDDHGRIVHLNAQALRLGGFEPGQVDGRELAAVFPDYARALNGTAPWRSPQEVELSYPGEYGHIHERVYLRPLPDGAYLIIMDETAAHQSERERAQTARLASVGFMLAGVCHEVSNPLAATYSMVQLLQSQDELSERALREGLDRIAGNVKRILEVSRRINEFCRIGQRGVVRVDDAIDDAMTLLREDRRYGSVTVEHHRNPEALVRSDVGHLRQVFYNLLLNACQAMQGEGKVIIRTERDANGGCVVSVEDSGPGIPPEHLEKLFEPFFTTKPSGEGTGLGLAIVRDLLREHGSTISVSNNDNGGARFELEFPLENVSQ